MKSHVPWLLENGNKIKSDWQALLMESILRKWEMKIFLDNTCKKMYIEAKD